MALAILVAIVRLIPGGAFSTVVPESPYRPAVVTASLTSAAAAHDITGATAEPSNAGPTYARQVVQPNYVVKPGDTLWDLSVRFRTTVDELAGINNLKDKGKLSIGQRLVVPTD